MITVYDVITHFSKEQMLELLDDIGNCNCCIFHKECNESKDRISNCKDGKRKWLDQKFEVSF